MASLAPTSISDLADAVRSVPHLLAVGAQTKRGLSALDIPKVSTKQLSGITEYDPGEFTFTALAGTPLSEIHSALAEKGQYLPFDPLLVEAGATLGGTVASGLSGPGRFRFGGVRDFILGVRFVDGSGRVLRMGGKVVKNAAGFDLPKFFVGSLGRFGVLAEITFKVFPRALSSVTLCVDVHGFRVQGSGFEVQGSEFKVQGSKVSAQNEPPSAEVAPITVASQIMIEASKGRWEIDALDLLPDGKTLCLRLAGPAAALEQLSADILTHWHGRSLETAEADALWSDLREFRWAYPQGPLVKVPLTPQAAPDLFSQLVQAERPDQSRIHLSAGGNVAFISLPSAEHSATLDQRLRRLKLSGLGLRAHGPLWYGQRPENKITLAVKQALDPEARYPSLDS